MEWYSVKEKARGQLYFILRYFTAWTEASTQLNKNAEEDKLRRKNKEIDLL
jgi:hypothetical protein